MKLISSVYVKCLFSVLTIAAPALALAATPNLTGKFNSVNVVQSEQGQKRIQFEIEVMNVGSAPAVGDLRIKPFLVAEDQSHEAVVLPNLNSAIQIEPGAKAVLKYDQLLLNLPKRNWWLGGVINPNWAIHEVGPRYRYDNTPNLIRVGRFEVVHSSPLLETVKTTTTATTAAPSAAAAPSEYDLYSRVVDANELSWGNLSHSLRAIARGSNGSDIVFASNQLRALFGVINFKTAQVTLLDYNRNSDPENPEKEWFAVSWSSEKEASHSDIQVDYYSNNIGFAHVAPGEYSFFTLLNSQDLVPEKNIYDNMDLVDLDLSLLRFPKDAAIFAVSSEGKAVDRSIRVKLPYPGLIEYEATLSFQNQNLVSTTGLGNLNDEDDLRITFPGLAAGVYEGSLKIKAKLIAEGPLAVPHQEEISMPVKYWVSERSWFFDGPAPKLEKSADLLEFKAHQGRDSEPQQITLKNKGDSVLEFQLKPSKKWIKVSQAAGRVAPGGEIAIQVTATASANLGSQHTSYAEGSIIITTNTSDSDQQGQVRVTLQTRNQ